MTKAHYFTIGVLYFDIEETLTIVSDRNVSSCRNEARYCGILILTTEQHSLVRLTCSSLCNL